MTNLRWKIVTVLAVFILFFAVGPYPILAARYHLPIPSWLQEKQLKLGLDLKGGVHLVLRVQTDDALRLETDLESERLRDELRTRNIPVGNVVAVNTTQFRVDGVPPAQDGAFRTAANIRRLPVWNSRGCSARRKNWLCVIPPGGPSGTNVEMR